MKFNLLALIFLLGCSGCDNREKIVELNAYIKQIKSNFIAQPVGATQISTVPKVSYTAQHLPSPFADQSVNTPAMDRPLTGFDLTSLNIVGIVMGAAGAHVFMLAPDGKIYKVKTGDVIGLQMKKIAAIDLNGIVLVEDNKKAASNFSRLNISK